MTSLDYPVFLVFSKEDDAWLARVDLLPGCVADGSTPEQALANAKVAIQNWIESCKELGRQVPAPLDTQGLEDMHLKAIESQGEQIQKLIQQSVSQAIQQLQQVMSFPQDIGTIGRPTNFGYSLPPARVSTLSKV